VFTALTLPVEIEALIASAGLGQHADAERGLAALIERLAANGSPLTNGELHETGVRIALIAGDDAAARAHLEQMQRCYRGTGIPSLVQHCETVAARVGSGASSDLHGNGSLGHAAHGE